MKIRVLVVDDFPLFREGVSAALRADRAFEVVGEASDGVEAAEVAAELDPDVVLLDMMMPGCDGAAAVELLGERAPRSRVLAYSASLRIDLVREALAAGARGYVSKVAAADELRQAVVEVYGGAIAISRELADRVLRQDPDVRSGDAAVRALLSDREHDVLRLVTKGWSDSEVAVELGIRLRTVQSHLARVREKTGLRRRSELVIWAMQHGLL
jgi:DNA-binding NarL/FixJ family response regulator